MATRKKAAAKQPQFDKRALGTFEVRVEQPDGSWKLDRPCRRYFVAESHAENLESEGKRVQIVKTSDTPYGDEE